MFIRGLPLPSPTAGVSPGGGSGFTSGAVIIADSTGALNEDPTVLFWDTTNNFLGVGTNAPASVLHVTGSVSPAVGASAAGVTFASTLVEAASGTHARLSGVEITAPTITAGAAATTVASSLYISGAPTGGTTNYVIEAAPDADATFVFGRTVVGHLPATDWVGIAHYDRRATGSTDYALGQGTAGNTVLNSASDQDLVLAQGGSGRWKLVATNGHLLAALDNTYDIGASGATRPRTGYFGTSANITQVVTAAGATALTVAGAAHTAIGLGAEQVGANFNFSATKTWATGALATQREVLIQAPTYAFVGASTLTTAVTLAITGAPTQGTNATITNAIALRVGGAITQSSATSATYTTISVPAHTVTLSGTTDVTSTVYAAGASIGQITISNTGSTVTAAASLYVANVPTISGGGTLTNAYGGLFDTPSVGTATTVWGLTVRNATAAGAGAQQYSGLIELEGQGWKTNATAASQQVKWALQTRPVQGGANPTSTLDFLSSINGAAYSSLINFNSVGDINTTGHVFIPAAKVFGIGAGGASAQFYITGNTFAAAAAASDTNIVLYGNLTAGSTGNEIVLQSQATRTAGNLLNVTNNGTGTLSVAYHGGTTITQTTTATGSPSVLTVTGGVNAAGYAADTEAIDVNFNLARTVTFTAGGGTFTTQRAFVIQRPSYAFSSADTIVTAVTVDITGAPTQGANATITNAIALRVGGAITQSSATSATYRTLEIPAHTVTLTGTTQITSVPYATGIYVGQITLSDASAVTVDSAASFVISAAPIPASSAAITKSYGALVSGATTLASAAGIQGAALIIAGHTFTLTGTTQVTSTVGYGGIIIEGITITDASAVTMNAAASLYITGAPTAAGSVTLTKTYSLWIDAGLPRIDSTTANGTTATVLGSLGPAGANTTVQEWLTVDIGGTTRYIPCF